MIEKPALLSVMAGICGATGSVFGKSISTEDGSSFVSLVIMSLYAILMVSFNTGSMLCFVKSLDLSESSLPSTVTSAAVNYCCSAFLGWLIFKESCGLLWWAGSTLVIAGILLMSRSSAPKPKTE